MQLHRLNMNTNRQRGYTLLELLLVMGLLVAVASIVTISVIALPEAHRLSRAADDLRGLLAGLRFRAMEEGKQVTWSFTPETGTYSVKMDGKTPSSVPDETAGWLDLDASKRVEFDNDRIFGEHELPNGVIFRTMSGSAGDQSSQTPTVRFNPDGSATTFAFELHDSASGTVQFRIRGVTSMITVKRLNQNGQVVNSNVASDPNHLPADGGN